MNPNLIDWNKPTELYILTIDSFVKFGITSNWNRREIVYKKDFPSMAINRIKSIPFDFRWEAELIEQIVKWRLRKWAVYGRHEWVELPIQPVLDCISQTIAEIKPEFQKHQHIHTKGTNRWDFYKQIAHYYFEKE